MLARMENCREYRTDLLNQIPLCTKQVSDTERDAYLISCIDLRQVGRCTPV